MKKKRRHEEVLERAVLPASNGTAYKVPKDYIRTTFLKILFTIMYCLSVVSVFLDLISCPFINISK